MKNRQRSARVERYRVQPKNSAVSSFESGIKENMISKGNKSGHPVTHPQTIQEDQVQNTKKSHGTV